MSKEEICWLLSLALLGLFLAPGFSSFESPPVEHAMQWGHQMRLGLPQQPSGLYAKAPSGFYYSVHEPGSLLVSLPIAYVAAHVGGSPDRARRIFELLCSLTGAMFFAGTMAALMLLVRQSDSSPSQAYPLLALAIIGSQFIVYQGSLADVSLSACLFSWLIFAWKRADETEEASRFVLAGLLAGLLATFKITNVAIAPVILVLLLTKPTRRRLLATAAATAGFVIGIVPLLIWNRLRTGSPFATPYASEFTEAVKVNLELIPSAALGTLVSPGKGLLVYTPLLLLAFLAARPGSWARANPRLSVLIFGSFFLALARISASAAWTGYGGWGIRYYVVWIPVVLTVILLEVRKRSSRLLRGAFAALMAAGLAINGAALITNFHYRQSLCGAEAWQGRSALTCAVAAAPANLGRTLGLPLPETSLVGASARNQRISNRLAFWWYGLRYAGVPPTVSWLLGLSLFGSSAVLARAARRLGKGRAREPELPTTEALHAHP